MKIEQGTAEWHAQRRGRFTSSRFGDLMKNGKAAQSMGEVCKSYILEIAYEIVTGESVGFSGNAATDWGTEHEEFAVLHYEGVKGTMVDPVGFCAHPTNAYAGGSPDGLVDNDGIIEVKCPYNGLNHAKNIVSNDFVQSYQWQVQGNLWVTGRQWCDMISFDPRFEGAKKIHIVRVERSEQMIQQLEDRIDQAVVLLKEYLEKLGHEENLLF